MSGKFLLLVAATVGLAACGDVGTPPLLPVIRAPDPRAEAIADISRRVRRLAGTGLKECGVILAGDASSTVVEVLRAVDCGLASSRQRQPFWLAFEDPSHMSFHSIHAQGLFAGPDGVPFRFDYESNFTLSNSVRPSFVVGRCPRPFARNIGLGCS